MIAISQPTFFPWLGYFDLIDQVDNFVILDDAEFSKQSWHQRNKFKTFKKLEWFTVPVKVTKIKSINEIKIFNAEKLYKKFKSFIITNYSKSNYFNIYSEELFYIFKNGSLNENLSELNISIINFFLKILKIKTNIRVSSDMKIIKKRSEKIVSICEYFKEYQYLSSFGAKEYLETDRSIFEKKKINVFLHNYNHPTYNQLYKPFFSNACILDLVFNEGERSYDIIKRGREKNIFLY